MKLTHFDSVTRAEEGVEFVLVDPVTKQPSEASITLYGADSRVYKTAMKDLQERHRRAAKQITAADAEEDSLEILAACTKAWKGIEQADGKPYPCTEENAKALYRQYPEIYEQAGRFAMTRSNFFATASEG